jgi:DNA repair exonuclease SbcCD ATPase subunit
MTEGWNIDTLKEHLEKVCREGRRHTDDKFDAQEKAIEKALTSAKEAVDKAERLADLRAKLQDERAEDTKRQQNEWRGTVNDITGTMVSRTEWATAHAVIEEKLDRLQVRMDRAEAEGVGRGQLLIWVFLGVAAFVSILGIIIDLSVGH